MPLAMQTLANPWQLTRAQKYHSIHQSGKRLEDVLTEEELKELREWVLPPVLFDTPLTLLGIMAT